MSILGRVDHDTMALAIAKGIDFRAGSLRRDGRVILQCPQVPMAQKNGACLRSRVVWWLRTGEAISDTKTDLHHKNHDRSDDRFSNLEKLDHAEHSRIHNPADAPHVDRKCRHCERVFAIKAWRLKTDETRGQYCSQACYHARTVAPRMVGKVCGCSYQVRATSAWRAQFCSKSCRKSKAS